MIAFYIAFAIALIAFMIITHELGHYFAAKAFGCKIKELAFGFGPKLWGTEKNGIKYSIRAFPFGGFCDIEGETTVTKREGEGLLCNLPAWKQIIVFIAGIVVNFITGLIMMGGAYLILGHPFLEGVLMGFKAIPLLFTSLWMLLTGQVASSEVGSIVRLVSDVGGYATMVGTVGNGIAIVLYLMGIIAINLAIVNALPIPALDGGRVFMIVLNKVSLVVRKKPLSDKFQKKAIRFTTAILYGLMIFLLLNDAINMF